MIKAKTLTLVAKIIAVVFVVITFMFFNKSATEVVIVGGFIAGAFVPVDISMIMKHK